MSIHGTASPLEIFWTLDALFGAGLALYLLGYWVRQRNKKRCPGEGLSPFDFLLIRQHIERKVFYLVCHLCYVLLGVMVMLVPSRPPVNTVSRYLSDVFILTMLVTSLGMQRDMLMSLRRYRRVETAP